MSGTYNPMPEASYEAIFKYAGEASTSKGKPCINITLVLRNDVDQPYKNKFIWRTCERFEDYNKERRGLL